MNPNVSYVTEIKILKPEVNGLEAQERLKKILTRTQKQILKDSG